MNNPKKGGLATVQIGSDKYPYKVVDISPTGAKVIIQRILGNASVRRNSDEFELGQKDVVTRRQDGSYAVKGTKQFVNFGYADYSMDPHF